MKSLALATSVQRRRASIVENELVHVDQERSWLLCVLYEQSALYERLKCHSQDAVDVLDFELLL